MSPVESPASPRTAPIRFENTYANLGAEFAAKVRPDVVASPRVVQGNDELARLLQIDVGWLHSEAAAAVLAGNRVADGSQPLAQAYAGHQFGHFVPQLGDGRARLLGEVRGTDGVLYDVQLKGAGPTPFSRRGDGRAALGPVLREYVVSEAMFAMGIPTTRALAAVTTGERVYRETAIPGAVLTRVASSHLRVGTFQLFWAKGDVTATQRLADYAIARHYPEAETQTRKYRAFLEGVIARQARLVAQWMSVGFIHGVMNTDNTSISGETIDYGPCAFLEAYEADKVFSSIDRAGRYAYSNQPHAMHWNLTRLAECLLPLLNTEEGSDEAGLASAHEALANFAPRFESARTEAFRHKLGLRIEREEDAALIEDLLQRMEANKADFTLTFRTLCDAVQGEARDEAVNRLFENRSSMTEWMMKWRTRLQAEERTPAEIAEGMRRVNPAYIPRNHQVQLAIDAATQHDDFEPFRELLETVTRPYDEQPGAERYSIPAEPDQCVLQTFCGT